MIGDDPIRAGARHAWSIADPQRKCEAVASMVRRLTEPGAADGRDEGSSAAEALPRVPGRPARPRLVAPGELPRRSMATAEGRAALLHAIAHIEFNAINLALDAVWRFDGVPPRFRADWLSVAADEARHFTMLERLLRGRGFVYGDFDAHSGLWDMAERTRDDVLDRMALVPRVLEARGLDATPPIQAKLSQAGDTEAVEVLAVILAEEVRHVAIGTRWFRWFCAQRGLDPAETFAQACRRHRAPRALGTLNREARLAAGFSEQELKALEREGAGALISGPEGERAGGSGQRS